MRLLFLLITLVGSTAWAGSWESFAPGMEHRKASLSRGGSIHFFRFSLSQWKLAMVPASLAGSPASFVKPLAQKSRATLMVNGGFFTPTHKPLGLRISNGKESNPIKDVSWWGIFAVVLGKPTITSLKEYAPVAPPQFAIQSGPRLIVAGRIPTTLKEGVDPRSGIGYTPEGLVVIAVTEGALISTTEFAQWMRSSEGGGCQYALNLDGGSSSQLYYSDKNHQVSVENLSPVADGVGVFSISSQRE